MFDVLTRTWNGLPPDLRLPELPLSTFKRQLKTHMALPPLLCWLCLVHTVVRRRCDYLRVCGADYKRPDSTQLNVPASRRRTAGSRR